METVRGQLIARDQFKLGFFEIMFLSYCFSDLNILGRQNCELVHIFAPIPFDYVSQAPQVFDLSL
jgi:hypothetical protein